MHNDVKQYFRGSNVHCGNCSHEEGSLNVNNADMCSDVAGPSSSGSDDLVLALDPVLLLFPPLLALMGTILDLSMTTTSILPFGACYVIMHNVRSS